jgi:DNA repair exonuclease SbcCD nuclease subunit
MKKFLFLTDSHFRSDSPKLRIDNAYNVQFQKLGEILTLVREYDIDAVLHGGDFFDTKKPPHELVADMIDWCKHIGIPIFVVIGNHDVTGYNLDSVRNSGLGVLLEAGAVHELKEEVYKKENLILRGIHHSNVIDKKQYAFDSKYADYTKIVMTHNMIIPVDSMPYDFVHPKDLTCDVNADLVLCGHYHIPFDWTDKKTKTRWVNLGPLCRWTISEQNHIPQVMLIEVDNNKFKVKKLPLESAKPGNKVFDLDFISSEKKREQDIQSFVKSLEQTTFSNIDIEKVIQQVGQSQNVESSVIEEALKRIKIAKAVLV